MWVARNTSYVGCTEHELCGLHGVRVMWVTRTMSYVVDMGSTEHVVCALHGTRVMGVARSTSYAGCTEHELCGLHGTQPLESGT